MIRAILVDMDGVLVDFDRGYIAASGKAVTNSYEPGDPTGEWLRHNAISTRFFEHLPPMADFREMRSLMRSLAFNYEVRILSSCGRSNPYPIREQKRAWLDNNGLSHVQFNFCEHPSQKAFFADSHTILVDDNVLCTKPFEDASGHSIVHISADETIRQLSERFNIEV